jgi:hypothetical protein
MKAMAAHLFYRVDTLLHALGFRLAVTSSH